MNTHHRFQAIADPQGANVWIYAGTRRAIKKRLEALTIPRPFRVELWHHYHFGDIGQGNYSCSVTRQCHDLIIR